MNQNLDAQSAQKESRLVARVTSELQEFIKNAADLTGATLSQFIVDAVTAKARDVIDSELRIQLTLKGASSVFEALENPPKTNQKLLAAASRFRTRGKFYYAEDGSTEH